MKAQMDILVIDDEPVITRAVQKVCAAEGLSVDIEEGGAAGLSRLKSASYRLIICDLMMPGVGGGEFLAEAARMGVRTPVIIATGYATLENAVISLSHGAIDFIPKPFTAEELLAAVRRAISCDRLKQECETAPPGALPPSCAPCPPLYYRLGSLSWAKVESEGSVVVGAGGLFLEAIEPIKTIELMKPGEETLQGAPCAAAISAAGDRHPVLCPISGRIAEVNTRAAADPALSVKDPYLEGWLYRLLPTNLQAELGHLTASGGGTP
ncbi:MAG: response regulator [Elusimicrobiales bacterium]|nr:response regulator [Elusimicrobiales bacterium]